MNIQQNQHEGYISDDSSFYGNEEEQERLHSLERTYSPSQYWESHSHDINTQCYVYRKRPESYTNPLPLFNPFEGNENARQLAETVADFVRRIPPGSQDFPWLWCSNPHRKRKAKDSWNREEHGDSFLFELKLSLDGYLANKAEMEKEHPHLSVTRKMKPARGKLKENILSQAKQNNFTSGKWMLFPKLDVAPRIWKLVCEAVVNNKLGPCAKIAGSPSPGEETLLICVYTDDFSDEQDVSRVVKELANMGLVAWPGGTAPFKKIYYKCDIYTELSILSNNEYDIQASLYNSTDILKSANKSIAAR